MTEFSKPLPVVDDGNRPFWEATKRGELLVQRCGECGSYRYPFSELCPRCLSSNTEWVKTSGRGEVYSWVVFHQPFHRGFANDLPYIVALVELEEGVRFLANIVGCPPEEVTVGMPVQAVFEKVTEEITLPKFTPV